MVGPEDGTAVLADFDLAVSETLEDGFLTRTTIFVAVHLCAILCKENVEPLWSIGARRNTVVLECGADMVEEAWAVASMFAEVGNDLVGILLVDSLG